MNTDPGSFSDKSKRATTDGQPARPGYEDASAPAPARPDGQHEAYWILSGEERAKGFVRPVRSSYRHVGRVVCGTPREETILPPGYVAMVCVLEPHEGDCTCWRGITAAELERMTRVGRLGGCDSVTSMGRAIAETYARDPKFYGSTFCCGCGAHFPVGADGEFVWDGTRERVGT